MTNWTKKQVLAWFGNRGVVLQAKELKAWHWNNGKLFFVHSGNNFREATEDGHVDCCLTHREDGSPILDFELFDTIPLEDSPLHRSPRPTK